ncbi:MAG TPA: response regulator, partial [Polyangiaceae bacterium]|nr:response regulator [Polyangiaceae bacterium]
EHLPDAVVLDFSMPEMDGAEVLRRLKADGRTRLIPVVMLTAVPELVGPSARGACAAFLAKPCEPEVLVRTLCSVMAPRAPQVAPEEPPRESTGE